MKKPLVALLAAGLMTACVGASMLAIGAAALINPNSTAPANSPKQASAVASTVSQQAQVQQLQGLIAQYQSREQQYQAQINQLNNLITQYQSREKQYQAQLDQVTTQAQQSQQILDELQRRGVIRILSDGTIQLLVRRN